MILLWVFKKSIYLFDVRHQKTYIWKKKLILITHECFFLILIVVATETRGGIAIHINFLFQISR